MTDSTDEQIQILKDVLSFPLSLAMAWDEAKEDGEINFTDLPLLMNPIGKLIAAVVAVPSVWGSLKELTSEQHDELNDWAKEEFDIADDELELKIENGLQLVGDLAAYIAGFIKE